MRYYETDFFGWAEDTAGAIRRGEWDAIDRAALAHEVEKLAKQARRDVRTRLEVLLLHLLETRYQPERATRSWLLSVRIQRDMLERVLAASLSLRDELPQLTANAYAVARRQAQRATALDKLPAENPFTDAEIWDT